MVWTIKRSPQKSFAAEGGFEKQKQYLLSAINYLIVCIPCKTTSPHLNASYLGSKRSTFPETTALSALHGKNKR